MVRGCGDRARRQGGPPKRLGAGPVGVRAALAHVDLRRRDRLDVIARPVEALAVERAQPAPQTEGEYAVGAVRRRREHELARQQ